MTAWSSPFLPPCLQLQTINLVLVWACEVRALPPLNVGVSKELCGDTSLQRTQLPLRLQSTAFMIRWRQFSRKRNFTSLWNPKANHRVHKSSPSQPTLTADSVHNLIYNLSVMKFNIMSIFSFKTTSVKKCLPCRFPYRYLLCIYLPHASYTLCLPHYLWFDQKNILWRAKMYG